MPMTGRLSNKHGDSSQSVASRADRFKNPEYRSDNWLIGRCILLVIPPLPPVWRNWQTQGTQNPPTARSSRFDPEHRHQPFACR